MHQHATSRRAAVLLAPVLLGAILGCAVLYATFAHQRTDFEAVGLGLNTAPVYELHDGDYVHCSSEPSIRTCLSAARARPVGHRDMLMGASQLFAVNEYRDGEHSAPWLLTDAMRRRGRDLFAISVPNANFQEMLVVYQEVRHQIRLDGLVLAALYDDMREQGVRDSVRQTLTEPAARQALAASEIGRSILAESMRSQSDAGTAAPTKNEAEPSLQDRSEGALTGWLERCCELWALRAEARGQFAIWSRKVVHVASLLRNRYTRDLSQIRIPVPDADYQRNRAALEAMLADAHAAGIKVMLYIVPRPTDFFPYDPAAYAAYKQDMAALAARHGAALVNIEDVVPNEHWGLTEITVGYPVRDHFHFKATGHRLMADALAGKIPDLLP